eukprot:1152052-Pelagomonas_calceolata.AAC.9
MVHGSDIGSKHAQEASSFENSMGVRLWNALHSPVCLHTQDQTRQVDLGAAAACSASLISLGAAGCAKAMYRDKKNSV